jgi:hypothetical protein
MSRRGRSPAIVVSGRASERRDGRCQKRSRANVTIAGSPVYLDTSALAKLYFPEPESVELDAALVARRDLFVSDLAITELTSATARQMRDGALSPATRGGSTRASAMMSPWANFATWSSPSPFIEKPSNC